MSEENKKEKVVELLEKFQKYWDSADGQQHVKWILQEQQDVKKLVEKLKSLDRNTEEFTELVLYGLLPYSKSKYAKRVSLYAAFMNIKPFFNEFNYDDKDWKNVANRIFDLISKIQENPDNLNSLIKEFTDDKYSRRLQSGSITPILYCLNDKYPVVNGKVINTYESVMNILGIKDKISRKLSDYPETIEKLKRFVEELDYEILKNNDNLDIFCYWYDEFMLKDEPKEKSKKSKKNSEDVKIENVNIPEIIQSIDFSLSDYVPHSLRNPERIKIRDIIVNVERRWVLPNFQRYFDWTREDLRQFLESIFNDYYIGAFLLWDASDTVELDIIPIMGAEPSTEKPERIILDGQQRITSLYYAIKSPKFKLKKSKAPSYFYINFKDFFKSDEKDSVIEVLFTKYSREECYSKMLFPFYELESHKSWIDGFEDYLIKHDSKISEEKIRSMRRVIERRLNHIWDGFEIPYISLPESMSLKQVTDIFERINTKGKLLSVFDLLIARLLINKIKLRVLWEGSSKKFESIKKYTDKTEKIPIYLLQAISLFYNKTSSCKREDILNIFQNVYEKSSRIFEEDWNEFAQYLDIAIKKIENLRSGYGVKDKKELPFVPMLPILAALLKEIEPRENKADCYKKLDMWYWSSVFSNAFSSAVDSRLTSDFKEMRTWFSDDNKIPRGISAARKEFMSIDFREVESHGNAMYKGILCLLALEGTKDFDTKQTLEMARKNHMDHIFPKSRKFGFGSFRDIDSILNMTWMSKETNTKIKKWTKPSVYVKEFINQKYDGNEKEFKDLLKTHFIDEKAYEHMMNDNFEGFISARQEIIYSKIRELIGADTVKLESALISPDTPFSNKIMFWDTIKQCTGYIHWIDKYFSKKGLEILAESVDVNTVKEIKIVMAIEKVDESFRNLFKDFREQMKHKGVSSELRVITESKLKSSIHDRWISSKNKCFNIPSPDIMARGQYSEIKSTENRPPFNKWWEESKDIIQDWNEIKELMTK